MPKPLRKYLVKDTSTSTEQLVDIVTLYTNFNWLPHEADELADLRISEGTVFDQIRVTRIS